MRGRGPPEKRTIPQAGRLHPPPAVLRTFPFKTAGGLFLCPNGRKYGQINRTTTHFKEVQLYEFLCKCD